MTFDAPQDALGRFRALVMANEALAEALSQVDDGDGFVALALGSANDRGIALDADTVRAAITPDPLGLARWTGAPAAAAPIFSKQWPPRQWLPAHVAAMGDRLVVDWLYFGAAPLTAPFFEDSIRRALARPFNRMFRYRMAIGDLLDDAAGQQSLAPTGFIFHMSRCGSTLVSRMLAALAHNVVISEAAAIDAVVQLSRAWPDLAAERQRQLLAAIVAALGRGRSGRERHYFIKLDSWHALVLPLFRRAFPSVPWVFLYRDPVEVLVSQMRQRGAQMVPELVSPSLYGIDGADGMASEEYCARVLARICQAAADGYSQGGGLLINYRELPGAVVTKVLPHFGVAYGEQECETIMRAALYDAKAPSFEFADDSESKQRQASELIRAQAARHLGAVYRRLEQLRGEGKAR